MVTAQLKNIVTRVAEGNPNGFTFIPSKKSLASVGYVVACRDTQNCVGRSGLWQVIKFYLRHTSYCIGGWRNEDGEMQYDASMIYYNLNDAIQAAIANDQRAFYNLYTGQEIRKSQYSSFLGRKVA